MCVRVCVCVCVYEHWQDPYGYTAVHFAAQRNHVRVLECLLAHGAPPDGVHAHAHAHVRVCVRGHSTAPSDPKQRVCKATPLHRAGNATVIYVLST